MRFFIVSFIIALSFVLGTFAEELRKESVPAEVLTPHVAPESNFFGGKVELDNAVTFPSSPTYGAVQFYSDSSCTTYTSGFSMLVNTCLRGNGFYVKYTCTGSGMTQQYYSDSSCTFTAGSTTTFSANTCGFSNGQYAKIATCGSYIPNPYNLPSVTYTYYQNNICTQIVGSNAIANNRCVVSGGTSTRYQWPYYYYYASSTTCTGVATSGTISSTCTAPSGTSTDTLGIQYLSYSNYVYASAFSNISFGLGAIVSMLVVAFQLLKI